MELRGLDLHSEISNTIFFYATKSYEIFNTYIIFDAASGGNNKKRVRCRFTDCWILIITSNNNQSEGKEEKEEEEDAHSS